MNMPPPLANIYECPIILPAIQDNRIANYKAKDFCPQPLRDLALGYALGHGLFYCNIGCPVNLSFLTIKVYRTVTKAINSSTIYIIYSSPSLSWGASCVP